MSEEVVTYQQWDIYARRLERKGLREHHKSLTASSISRAANHHIIEVQDDRKTLIVTGDWRKSMRAAAEAAFKGE